ncbi:MAG: hypothetical protein FJ314_06035 [SAR202 cluster bacterium]|nr:hypothetical protein [SAR202 cluster bacterium]
MSRPIQVRAVHVRPAFPDTSRTLARTYLVVGGDPAERGLVAGNVARAAGTTFTSVDLERPSPIHPCEVRKALAAALAAEHATRRVLMVEHSDLLFSADRDRLCASCAETLLCWAEPVRSHPVPVVFAVDSPPGAESGWRPDTVVYLPVDGSRFPRITTRLHRGHPETRPTTVHAR